MAPNGPGPRQPRVSTTAGLIASIAVTALAGLGILIVLLLGAFRIHSAPGTPAPTSSSAGGASSTTTGEASSASTPVEVVMIPTAITVNINGGNSGLPEWTPILVAVIGVFGAVGSAFITYFVQQGKKEPNQPH